jgi:ubiquinone/menaquinone biosynthesis C-methylase UbiE/DNA-directed RNA polymerase subunit RPC12/RpoP
MLYWIIGGILALVGVIYFFDREIYFYEATHLGPRVQSWLYDRWAAKYDNGKKESIARDAEMLARPVLDFIKDISAPLILDLASGTGRFPLALLSESDFNGHVVAVDVSAGMLTQASQKLEKYQGRFTLVRKLEYPLPFPDAAFDVVSCMEALEVMPEMDTPLVELFRILKPGGMLLSSRATDASGRKTKIRSVEVFKKTLNDIGFEQVDIIPWWRWFDRVTARKPGVFSSDGNRSVMTMLVCAACHATGFEITDTGLMCSKCGNKIIQNTEGVLML